jgi:hypothetical protein
MKLGIVQDVQVGLLLFIFVSYVPHCFSARPGLSMSKSDNCIEALHPACYFSAVRLACLDLGNDLDVVQSAPELQQVWCEQTDHLIDQFLRLYTSVANLITNKKEARTYLQEDACFLIELMELVYKKYQRLAASDPHINASILACLTILMHKSRQKIQELLKLNQETSLTSVILNTPSDINAEAS